MEEKFKLDRMVKRVKPWVMVYGSWFMVHSNILICKGLLLWTVIGNDLGLVNFFDAPCSSSHWPPGMTCTAQKMVASSFALYTRIRIGVS